MRIILLIFIAINIYSIEANAQSTLVTYYTGVADRSGKILIPMSRDTSFSFIDAQNSRMLRTFVNEKTGVTYSNNTVAIPIEYDRIYQFYEDYTLAQKNGKWGVIDKQGKAIKPFEFEDIKYRDKNLIFATLNGKRGAIDIQGNTKTPFIYDKINVDDEISEFYWGSMYAFHDAQYSVYKDYRTGAIDSTGRLIVPCKYDKIGAYDGWYTCVEDDNKWGYVDTLGNVAIPFVYDKAYPFINDIAVVAIDEKFGLINRSGKLITSYKYDYIENNKYGCLEGRIDGKYRLIDRKGKVILSPFDNIQNFKNGVYAVNNENKKDENDDELYAIVDAKGKMKDSYQYTDLSNEFSDDILILKKGNFYGGINTKGEEVIPFIYDRCDNEFNNGILQVERNGKEGIVDTTGREILPCNFKNIDYPNDRMITFSHENGKGVFDAKYKKILFTSSEYESLGVVNDSLIFAKMDKKWALISRDNQRLTPFIFDSYGYSIKHDLLLVMQNNKYGIIGPSGKLILACLYDQINVSDDGEILIIKNVKERKQIHP